MYTVVKPITNEGSRTPFPSTYDSWCPADHVNALMIILYNMRYT